MLVITQYGSGRTAPDGRNCQRADERRNIPITALQAAA